MYEDIATNADDDKENGDNGIDNVGGTDEDGDGDFEGGGGLVMRV